MYIMFSVCVWLTLVVLMLPKMSKPFTLFVALMTPFAPTIWPILLIYWILTDEYFRNK